MKYIPGMRLYSRQHGRYWGTITHINTPTNVVTVDHKSISHRSLTWDIHYVDSFYKISLLDKFKYLIEKNR